MQVDHTRFRSGDRENVTLDPWTYRSAGVIAQRFRDIVTTQRGSDIRKHLNQKYTKQLKKLEIGTFVMTKKINLGDGTNIEVIAESTLILQVQEPSKL